MRTKWQFALFFSEEMSAEVILLVLSCFLLTNTRVSSKWEGETVVEAGPVYMSSPPPNPAVNAPPPPPSPVAKEPPTATPPQQGKAPSTRLPPYVKPPIRSSQECIPLCVVRCKNHSRKNVCMRACSTCCVRCKCVPPGQYGNKEKCGKCYANMTTRGGRPKCP